MNRLLGKAAVITGGTRGIGLALVKAFQDEGAAVMICGRSQASVESAVRQLQAIGDNIRGMVADVTDLDQMYALAKQTIREFGQLDIWVNNAGYAGPYGPTLDIHPQTFYKVMQINTIGLYNGSRVAMSHFANQHQGKLINLLGHGAKGPLPFQNAYGSSKAWVRNFTKALAAETSGSGVGVFAYSPGMVLTDMLTDVEVILGSEQRLKNFATILRMWAKSPEEVTEKAIWLASSATDGKTGIEVSLLSKSRLLVGAMKEGLRTLFKLPTPAIDIKTRIIPPAN
jgi:NAD(P)-dependent dehydrogenase (short-subunit alcohol dehydrogenase family)